MICQWVFGVVLALWISPRTWAGVDSRIHLHVWVAVFLGGAVTSVPVLLALIAAGQGADPPCHRRRANADVRVVDSSDGRTD